MTMRTILRKSMRYIRRSGDVSRQKGNGGVQPHLFSRTRDFMEEFGRSLSGFDEVVLLDIYPAREEPIEGITSARLLEEIDNDNKQLVSKKELLSLLKKTDADVVLTLGAGDIGREVEKIREVLSEKAKE